jgi:ribulose-5-phosphate 4-epimerase/fuculose-1-phosphate aldolase
MGLKIGELEYPSLRGKVSEAEWQARLDLAALYRLIPLMGWWDLSQAPASAAVPGEPGHYLFNPLGFLFEEITASSLVKITLQGEPVTDTPLRFSRDIWYPMQAVHAARPDAGFVLHLHDDILAALSARKDKLLPVSQFAGFALAGGIAYHEFDGPETHAERMAGLQASLGNRYAMILQNHGAVVLGKTAYQIIAMVSNLRKAAMIQLLAGQSADLEAISPAVMPMFEEELRNGVAVDNLWNGLIRKLDRLDPSYKD